MSTLILSPIELESWDQSLFATGQGSFTFTERHVVEFNQPLNVDAGILFKLIGDLSVSLGYEIGVTGSIGGIDTQLGYTPTVSFLDDMRLTPGVLSSYVSSTGWSLDSGSFKTDPFDLEIFMDILYGAEGSLLFQIFGQDIINTETSGEPWSLPGEGVPTNDDGLGQISVFDIGFNGLNLLENPFTPGTYLISQPFADSSFGLTADVATGGLKLSFRNETLEVEPQRETLEDIADENGDLFLTYDLASIRFKKPNVSASGEYSTPETPGDNPTQTFSGSYADTFLEFKADLDGILSYIAWNVWRIPLFTEISVGFRFGLLGGSFNLALADVDFGPELRVRQDVDVTPGELKSRFVFQDLDGNPLSVRILDPTDGVEKDVFEWHGDWDALPQIQTTQAVQIKQQFSASTQTRTVMGLELGAALTAEFFRIKYSINTFDIFGGNAVSGQLGPEFSLRFDEDDLFGGGSGDATAGLFIPLFAPDTPTTVEGFNWVDGETFILDVEGTDDPGLSGIEDPDNIYAPVAVDDGTIGLVMEGGSIVLDADLLLANDYDPTARDTLTVSTVWASAAPLYASMNSDGTFRVTAYDAVLGLATGQTQTVTLSYAVRDAVGNFDTGTFDIDILGRDSAPVVRPDGFVLTTDDLGGLRSWIFPTATGLLANDFDADPEDSIAVREGWIDTSAGARAFLWGSGAVTYNIEDIQSQIDALAPGELLVDSFDYIVEGSDGDVLSSSATIAIQGAGGDADDMKQVIWAPTQQRTLLAPSGDSVTYAVFLTEAPTTSSGAGTDVEVTFTERFNDFMDLSTDTLTFDQFNWDTPQFITIAAKDGLHLPSLGAVVDAIASSADAGYNQDTEFRQFYLIEEPVLSSAASVLTVAEGETGQTTLSANVVQTRAGRLVLDLATDASDTTGIEIVDGDGNPIDQLRLSGGSGTLYVRAVDDGIADPGAFAVIRASVNKALSDSAYHNMAPLDLRVDILDSTPAPPITVVDYAQTQEETPVTIDVLANDRDPNGDPMFVVLAEADNGEVDLNDDGEIVYTPNTNFFGQDTIYYYALDGFQSGTTGVAHVTVTNVNDLPTPRETPFRVFVVDEDGTFTVDLNTLWDDPDGDGLFFDVSLLDTEGEPGGATASIEDGVLTVTMPENYTNTEALRGEDGNLLRDPEDGALIYGLSEGAQPLTLSYLVQEGAAWVALGQPVIPLGGSISFLVTPKEDAPQTGADSFQVDADGAIENLVPTLLANDSDADGDSLSVQNVILIEQEVLSGPVTLEDVFGDAAILGGAGTPDEFGGISYRPDPAYKALPEGAVVLETYRYEAVDPFGNAGSGTFTVRVTGVNDAPTAQADFFAFSKITGVGVLTDLGPFTDNDTDPDLGIDTALELVDTGPFSSRLGAEIDFNDDGTVSYRIAGGFDVQPGEVVIDSFTYTAIGDGQTYEGEAFVRVTGRFGAPEPGIVVSKTTGEVQEGGKTDTLWVALAAQPTDDVVVEAVSFSDLLSTEQAALTFTPENYDTPQKVTLRAVDDAQSLGEEVVQVRFEVAQDADTAVEYQSVSSDLVDVTVLDRAPAADIRLSTQIIQVDEGSFENDFSGSALFGISLGQRPDSDVVIRVENALSNDLWLSQEVITFTPDNWNAAQAITVAAYDNFDLNPYAYGALRLVVEDDRSDDAFDGQVTGVVAFVNDDEAFAFFATPPQIALEGPEGPVVEGTGETTAISFTVTRAGEELGLRSVVNYAVVLAEGASLDDFPGGELPRGYVEFMPGETEKTIVVEVLADRVIEDAESFAIRLGSSSFGRTDTSPVLVNLLDDEGRIIDGDDNDNTLEGTFGDDILNGKGGDDALIYSPGRNALNGGEGEDAADYSAAEAGISIQMHRGLGKGSDFRDTYDSVEEVVGTAYRDVLVATNSTMEVDAGGGDDVIRVVLGDFGGWGTRIYAGDGADKVFGSQEYEEVYGGAGADIVRTTQGDDYAELEDGDDVARMGADDDIVSGGLGDDRLFGNSGVDVLYGNEGADRLDGGGQADYVDGGDGDDALRGGTSRDTIVGGKGDDTLYGGKDTLGDGAADTFYFQRIDNGFDRIKDFEDNRDIINLVNFRFDDFDDVLAIARNSGDFNLKLDFGDGNAVVIENFRLDQLDPGDVFLG